MSAIDDNLIRDVTRRIVEHFHPRRIVLFGSHARGDATPDSDLDLMVEMESDKPFIERSVEVGSLFTSRKWPMDLVVFTPAEVETSRSGIGTLVHMIEDEGKVLYERP